MVLHYHDRTKPIPEGWRFAATLGRPHGDRYILIERAE
jgi:hypothetical protein